MHYGNKSTKDRIEISQKDGTILHVIISQLEIPTWDPHSVLDIYKWSKDSSVLYFRYFLSTDGGDYAFWWDGFDLQSIDIVTGNIQKVIPTDGMVSFAFSPDDTRIAYAPEHDTPYTIHILEFSTKSEKSVVVEKGDEKYIRIGDIHWSPRGNVIFFQTEKEGYWVQAHFLDLSTMQLKKIAEYKLFTIWPVGWTSDEKVKFEDEKGNVILIDPYTADDLPTSAVTPTP